MQSVPTYQKCTQCSGTGEISTSSGTNGQVIPCTWPGCVGGYIEIGNTKLDPGIDDVMDKLNDVIDKCNDILEAVNQ